MLEVTIAIVASITLLTMTAMWANARRSIYWREHRSLTITKRPYIPFDNTPPDCTHLYRNVFDCEVR